MLQRLTNVDSLPLAFKKLPVTVSTSKRSVEIREVRVKSKLAPLPDNLLPSSV
jgi:hypothetical protein